LFILVFVREVCRIVGMRIKAKGRSAVYHCISRVVGGSMLLDKHGKEVLRKQMLYMAEFCGVQVLAYCIMSNHFHVLVRVPEKQEVSDEDLLARYAILYRRFPEKVKTLEKLLKAGGDNAVALRQQLLARMGDVSNYMKELKQRFSIWYNRNHGRFGALWAERFKSVLVEDGHYSLQTVAAYIDLNPVRAGMVDDPKDYRWCSYAQVVAGNRYFTSGLEHILESRDRDWVLSEYRKLLYLCGASKNRQSQKVLSRDKVVEVVKRGGAVSRAEMLRLKIRYFTDGMALGSREFVESYFQEHRLNFGQKRETGARRMRGMPGFFTLRDLKKEVMS